MKILFLAPQPFYQERGTPIAVKLALETLAKRLKDVTGHAAQIDLLVYREGIDIDIPGVTIHRVPTPKWLSGIRPGISCKKLLVDVVYTVKVFSLLWRSRHSQYHIVHAVEESVFIAWFAQLLFKTAYVYDMDSSLAMQLTEKWWWFTPLAPIFRFLERTVVRGACAVAPVCDSLDALARQHGAVRTTMLRDISLLPVEQPPQEKQDNMDRDTLRAEIGIRPDQPLIMYVGNLESYQGIDLLLDSFNVVCQHASTPHLAVVGGDERTIEKYTQKVAQLLCRQQVTFLGHRPVASLKALLDAADILVSPRIKGNNTPMKVYSYLHSGKPLLATDLPTHTQVLNAEVSVLAPATVKDFASGMHRLLADPVLRQQIGERAQSRAQALYTVEAFEHQLLTLYRQLLLNTSEPSQNLLSSTLGESL